jgi:hypothetical protein
MDTKIKSIICGEIDNPFETYYASAKSYFENRNMFYELSGEQSSGLDWPNNPGVYIVWHKSEINTNVLYIGMTGKFKNGEKMSANQGLKGRRNRWTPYRFTEMAFLYDPKYEKCESRNKQPNNGYANSVAINEIRVDCFVYDTDCRMAPAFLEALLLQGYLMQYGGLPKANNEF